jgi:hypothetical protein
LKLILADEQKLVAFVERRSLKDRFVFIGEKQLDLSTRTSRW